ncbi:hypothetical protein CPB85DRAFT_297625 [Mucidula mucida]|nr:hypothetical protein CPB85DRAFT_297625 [Mucidula mucida]
MLSHDGVPMVPGSTNRFIVDHEHAAKWLNIILTVLVYIEEQVNTTTEHVVLMQSLTQLLLLLSNVPRQFWTLESLAGIVSISRSVAKYQCKEDPNFSEVTEDVDDLNVPLVSSPLHPLPFLMLPFFFTANWSTLPLATACFVRAMFTACACISASHYISHSAFLKQPLEVSYRALDLPLELSTFPVKTVTGFKLFTMNRLGSD